MSNDARGPVFIVNPRSANGATLRRFERARPSLGRALGPFEVRLTERTGHATELAREALRAGSDTIVSVGGDGTNNEVVNGFFDESLAPIRPGARLGVVTSGTGGDFRRAMGWSTGFDEAIARLQRDRAQPIDIGLARFTADDGTQTARFFLNIASFGLSGAVDEVVNRSSKALGAKASFVAGTLRAFAAFKAPEVHISVDDDAGAAHRISLVAVANGQYFGGGMWIAPDAIVDDGAFDIVRVDDAGKGFWLRNAAKVYSGQHRKLDAVHIRRGGIVRARALSNGPVLIDLDGEQPGMLPAEFEIYPAAISILR